LPPTMKFLLAGGLATLLVLYLARKPHAAVEDNHTLHAGAAITATM
jgi:hypothetical protein